MPEKDRSNTKSRFGRRKFIGHVVRDDPRINEEPSRPVEKRHLVTTNLGARIELANIPRTQRKNVNIEIAKTPPIKTGKPLRQKVSWKILQRELENERKRKKRENTK